MERERAAQLIETNQQVIDSLRTVVIPRLTDPYTKNQVIRQIIRLERQNAYHRRFIV